MRRYLLDTGIAGEFINDRSGVRARARTERARGNAIGICTPVLGELYEGVENSDTRERNLPPLVRAMKLLKIWPYDPDAARVYGRLRAQLRRIGRTMQVPDVQVAAVAFALGNCTVVSADSDLFAIPGLTVENWAAP